MVDVLAKQAFLGRRISSETCELGEGPTFDPHSEIAWWFDIKGLRLHEWNVETGRSQVHVLPFLASALARIDTDRQLIVADTGVFIRSVTSGVLTPYTSFDENSMTRSNDSRVHPCGAMWTSRMGRYAERGLGAIYHLGRDGAKLLFANLTIPNGICFSPDGHTAYFADSKINQFMRVSIDPTTALPTGEPELLVDETSFAGCIDGAVCDSEGHIWSARWGDGSIDVHTSEGVKVSRFAVPVSQVSCPAFIGRNLDRILVTSAWEDMNFAARRTEPLAGCTFELGVRVAGVAEPNFIL